MPNKIDIDHEDREWEGEGEFVPSMLDFSDFGRWLTMLTMEFQQVRGRFDQAMGNDGKVDIVEKRTIVKELDELMNCFIAFRFHLLEIEDQYEVRDEQRGFAYALSKTEDGWRGRGKFTKKYSVRMDRFSVWIENALVRRFTDFTAEYRESTRDGLIDTVEKERLYKLLDGFVFEMLVVRNFLEKGKWTD